MTRFDDDIHSATQDALVIGLYQARVASTAAKRQLAEAAQARGGWGCRDLESEEHDPCYRNPSKTPCADCQALQPLWEKRQAAATAAGAALRKVLNHGRNLSESATAKADAHDSHPRLPLFS